MTNLSTTAKRSEQGKGLAMGKCGLGVDWFTVSYVNSLPTHAKASAFAREIQNPEAAI